MRGRRIDLALEGAYPTYGPKSELALRFSCVLSAACAESLVVRGFRWHRLPHAVPTCVFDARPAGAGEGGEALVRLTVSALVPETTPSFHLLLSAPGVPSRHVRVTRDQWAAPLEAWRARRVDATGDATYDAWMRERQPGEGDLARLRAEAREMEAAGPLFSVVTPVFRTPEAYLRAMIDSVLGQTYGKLELVLVNASGPCPEVERVLASYDDPRLRVLEVENRSIAENTNAGIAVTHGDWVVFVDHDDFIEPDALQRYAEALRVRPEADLMFCDEDLYGALDGTLTYHGARFKPGWDHSLALTHDYVCHMLAVSRRALGLTERSGVEVSAAQDYDLTLRASEVARDIVCVPRVLYHWRSHPASTAENRDSKPYALEAGRRAVQAHLDRLGVSAQVAEGAYPFSYRVRYALPEPCPPLTLALDAAHGSRAALRRALASLGRLAWPGDARLAAAVAAGDAGGFRALLAEAAPSLAAGACVCEVPASCGRAGALNAAAACEPRGEGELLVLLDERCEAICDDMLAELAGPLARADVGCAAPLLLDPDDVVSAFGLVARPDGSFGAAERGMARKDVGYLTMLVHARTASAAPAAGLTLARRDFEALGGLDEQMGAAAAADLCLRLRARGGACTVVSYAPLRVWADPVGDVGGEERARIAERHGEVVAHDPCLSPALDPYDDLFRLPHEGPARP